MDQSEYVSAMVSMLNSSPFYLHMGMKVIYCGRGMSRLELRAEAYTRNLYGTVHGGVLASLIDSAGGVALGSLLEQKETAVTVDLRINYIAPVSGGNLIAEGNVIHRGKNTGVAEASVRTESGLLVAKGMTTHFLQKHP